MNKITSNPTAAPIMGAESTAISALLAASWESSPPEMDRVPSGWQEDDSSFFMPERCTPLDDF